MDAKEILQKYILVEGHRDVYEQIYRTAVGEQAPIRDAIAPRFIRDGVNVCVYAICGDSYSHSQTPAVIWRPPWSKSTSFSKKRRAPRA